MKSKVSLIWLHPCFYCFLEVSSNVLFRFVFGVPDKFLAYSCFLQSCVEDFKARFVVSLFQQNVTNELTNLPILRPTILLQNDNPR